jgi:hypothetical protein
VTTKLNRPVYRSQLLMTTDDARRDSMKPLANGGKGAKHYE